MKLKLLPLLLIPLVVVSCFRDETWNPNTWTHHFQGPIAKTTLDLEALTNLQEIRFVENILASEINPLWDGQILLPPVTGQSSKNSPQIFEVTEYFKALHTDSLIIEVEFTNGYPINFVKGTEFVFTNQENGEELFRHPIEDDVAPSENYKFNIEVITDPSQPQKVESNIEFYIDNFRTTGTDGEIRDFSGASTNFAFTLKFLSVIKLELYPDKAWSDTTTSNVSLFEDGADEQKIAEGKVTIDLVNGLPINGWAHIDILDANNNVVGQIFDDSLKIDPATIDPNTLGVINKTVNNVVVDLPFDKLDLFYQDSKLKIQYEMNTNGIDPAQLVIGEEANLKAKVKVDLKVYVDEIEISE
ncbi:MAG: hypothetical protein JXQ87_09200 [Bacteroidia bacterium]